MAEAIETAVARAAARHWGNVTTRELAELGLNRHAIRHRPWLFPEHHGVYSVGRPATIWYEHAAAAVLACGAGAALSHYSALALWGWATRWPWRFEVTVPGDRHPAGIKVHRSTKLVGRDFRTHKNIRVTSPARTLLDNAPILTDKSLARAVNDALLSEHLRRRQLKDVIARLPRHPGARLLKPFIDTKGGPTRSGWEDGFPAFCKQYGLPEPVMNTQVAGHVVDALFVEEKVIVELDSWKFHSSRESFESDRDRDADTLAADHETLRITWKRIERRPAREASRLHTILARRRRRTA